jgi:uncharacterized protein with HEPN domain
MNDRSALAWLRDARQFALEAQEIARDLHALKFEHQHRDRFAILFCLVVVGEALNAVPKSVQALAPEIPWPGIYNLRNRLIHGYWLIDTAIVLDIAQNKIAPLVASIDQLTAELE